MMSDRSYGARNAIHAAVAAAVLIATVCTANTIIPTERGCTVETDRYRAVIENAVLIRFMNKLTGEEYFDPAADPAAIVPHLPSGLGTCHTEPEREGARALLSWPWWEHNITNRWPNQHYVDAKSRVACRVSEVEPTCVLTYSGLTDGTRRFDDETYELTVEVDVGTGDLLLTPSVKSPRGGVYAANLTVTAIDPNLMIEAPIFDGVRLDRHT